MVIDMFSIKLPFYASVDVSMSRSRWRPKAVDDETNWLASHRLSSHRCRSSCRVRYDWLHCLLSDERPIEKAIVLDAGETLSVFQRTVWFLLVVILLTMLNPLTPTVAILVQL